MDNASILDLKIGYKTYNPNGSQLKKEKELKKA
jgi:histone deacetylase 6